MATSIPIRGPADAEKANPAANDDIQKARVAAGLESAQSGDLAVYADPGPPPNGGWVAWSQVLAGILANAVTWGYTTSFGVFQLYYAGSLGGHSTSAIAWIGSIQAFLVFFIGAVSGRATDAGLARVAVALGSFLLVLGIFMTSLATEYWQIFLAQGLCVGLGGGILYMPLLTVVGTYFSTRKSFAVGTAAGGTGIGGMVFPAIVQYLIPKIGYGWAVRCMAFITLLMVIVINIIIRPRMPPRKSGPIVELDAFKDAAYTLYTIAAYLIFWALFVGFNYIDLFARTRLGFTDLEAVNLLLLMNGIGIPTRMLMCWIADRFSGPINTMIPASACLALMFFCWTAVESRAGLYAFSVFYGISASATQGLFAGTLASITDDLGRLGVRMGMVFSLCGLSTLTGAPVAGAILGAQGGSFVGAQVWGGSVVITGSLFLLASRLCKTGFKLKVKL